MKSCIAPEERNNKAYARHALDAAAREHSGFRYHKAVGLVTNRYNDVVKRLEEYCAA